MAQLVCKRVGRVVRLNVVVLLTCLCGVTAFAAAEEAGSKVYHQEIAQAHADLDAGKIAAARQRLLTTDESQRGFEFEYLQARVRQGEEGKAAPDLIQKCAKPDKTEARYGVVEPASRQLVFICRDGSLRVHDLTAPESEVKVLRHPTDFTIWSGAFSLDGTSFFSGHENGDVLVWDVEKWEIRHTIPLGVAWAVRELAAAPDGSAFVAESQNELELWSLADETPKKVAGVGERYNFGEGLAFSPKGDMLATGGMFDVILHDAKTGQPLRTISHASYTMGLEFSPDGKRIASAPRGNVNKFLAVFDVTQDAPLFNAGPFKEYIAGMAFTPDGKRILATGCDKMVQLFDAETGSVTLTLKRPECSAKPAVSQDGLLIGWNESDGYRFIDLKEHAADTR